MKSATLSNKILAGALPVVLTCVIGFGIFNYLAARGPILRGVEQQLLSMARQTALTLEAFMEQRDRDLENLSEVPLLTDYYQNLSFGLLQEAETYRAELERYLLKFSERTALYGLIMYVDPAARPVAIVEDGKIVRARKQDAPWIRDVLRSGGEDPSPLLWTSGNEQHLLYVRKLKDRHGASQGRLLLTCELTYIKQLLDQIRVGAEGRATLCDAAGRPILNEPFATGNALKQESEIRRTPWKVVVTAGTDEFLRPLARVRDMTILFSLLAGLGVGGILIWIVRRSTKPIGDMAAGTQRFAEGDMAYRFQEPPNRELRVLSQAFNAMAQRIEQHTLDLESRIRQLTALREMEAMVLQHRDEETFLKSCLRAIAEGLSLDRAALYWVEPDRGEIAGRYLYNTEKMGFTEKSFQKRRVPVDGEDMLCRIVRTRTAVLIKNPAETPSLDPAIVRETQTRQFIGAPICGKDRVFGVLTADNFYSRRELEESDKEGLVLFSNAMGLALENATLLQHLTESEARYRTLLENSPVAVVGLSREHWITAWNRGAEQIFGYQAQEVTGKPLTVLLHPDAGTEYRNLLAQVMSQGSARDYPITGVTKKNRALDLSLSWGGSFADFWSNKEWAVVIHDVSEAKKLQGQIVRSEKLSTAGQLISSIAHELNNPLQAVVGYAQILSNEIGGLENAGAPSDSPSAADEKSQWKADLRMIVRNAQRCSKIIDNLLVFVRQGEVAKNQARIDRAIRDSLELLDYKLKKAANIRVRCKIPRGLPPVKADLQQIQQVLVNLINNACDALSDWKGDKKIDIDVFQSEDRVRVEIADSGPGVSEDIQDKIFEPFFTSKAPGRGTGLGLPVCRQIVEDHKGRMGFSSKPRERTVFWFDLPVNRGVDKQQASKPGWPASHKVKGKSVLLVDDEKDVLSFLIKAALAEGELPETAASLKESLGKISRQSFDLVVTDVQLGDGTGIDLYEHWSEWTEHPRPPFLFVTGDVLNGPLVQSIRQKGLPLLQKPVDFHFLCRSIRAQLCQNAVPKTDR